MSSSTPKERAAIQWMAWLGLEGSPCLFQKAQADMQIMLVGMRMMRRSRSTKAPHDLPRALGAKPTVRLNKGYCSVPRRCIIVN
jgi:hypothetical protein